MRQETKKELIHKCSDRIKEFYAGESTNADVDTCKLLADLINEVEKQANEINTGQDECNIQRVNGSGANNKARHKRIVEK